MIKIENKIISRSLFEKEFACNLISCKGLCCVEGDSGAPITKKEENIINNKLDKIIPYMSKKGAAVIKKYGVSVIDSDGDLTTSLVNDRECAFSFLENGITKCSIEKANLKESIDFRKPISCHLFPIRITNYDEFEAINYESIKICQSACEFGEKQKIPLYVFLKEALIRKYGLKFYDKILEVAKEIAR